MKFIVQVPIETDSKEDVKALVDAIDQTIDSVSSDPPWNSAMVDSVKVVAVIENIDDLVLNGNG